MGLVGVDFGVNETVRFIDTMYMRVSRKTRRLKENNKIIIWRFGGQCGPISVNHFWHQPGACPARSRGDRAAFAEYDLMRPECAVAFDWLSGRMNGSDDIFWWCVYDGFPCRILCFEGVKAFVTIDIGGGL